MMKTVSTIRAQHSPGSPENGGSSLRLSLPASAAHLPPLRPPSLMPQTAGLLLCSLWVTWSDYGEMLRLPLPSLPVTGSLHHHSLRPTSHACYQGLELLPRSGSPSLYGLEKLLM